MLEKVAEQSTNLSRPLTREQARQNAAFLRHLRRTGTVRESTRQAGVGNGAIQHRREGHPGCALRWDVADAMAQEAEDHWRRCCATRRTRTFGVTTGWRTRRCPRSTK